MTEEKIIKALKLHASEKSKCLDCPYYHEQACSYDMAIDALDLINRQKAEIERLKEQVNLWQEEAGSVGCANEWLKASLKNAKAEAIKEFAKRLKNEQSFYDGQETRIYLTEKDLDNLVKEMAGDAE